MIEDKDEQGLRENQAWQETRLKYLTLFDVSPYVKQPMDKLQRFVEKMAKEHPVREFEKDLMVFLREMWRFCRKPLLVQIEEGEVEGIPHDEFEDFKKKIFAPN